MCDLSFLKNNLSKKIFIFVQRLEKKAKPAANKKAKVCKIIDPVPGSRYACALLEIIKKDIEIIINLSLDFIILVYIYYGTIECIILINKLHTIIKKINHYFLHNNYAKNKKKNCIRWLIS